MRDLAERRLLATHGVHMLDTAIYVEDDWRRDYTLAMDAQPQLLTGQSAGIPAFLANIVDPTVIEQVLAPLRAAEIAGTERKLGDWLTQSYMMPLAESAGNVVAYGDYENGGTLDANIVWVPRQPFHYQSVKLIGERELGLWGRAGIDMNARKDMSRVIVFAQFQNNSYFYGVLGLQNYGILNDPSLLAPITPITKAAGGTAWTLATPEEEYEDIRRLYVQLQTQMGGNLEMTDAMVLALSTTKQADLAKTNSFGISVADLLKKNFPNLEIRAAPQYNTASGQLAQLSVASYQGDDTWWTGFTEKLRAHPVVQGLSDLKQKFSAGTWGAILRRPIAVASLLGI